MREMKVERKDVGVEKMMRDLRIKEGEIVSKDEEIKGLRSEIEDRVSRAREEHAREMKV